MIEYITASAAADKWGVSHAMVVKLCTEDAIRDVAKLGGVWLIPNDAINPFGDLEDPDQLIYAKPLVKWAGGKTQLIETIRQKYPQELGKSITKYCEPMVGGGAVMFDILRKYQLEQVLINDSNTDLMNVYMQVKANAMDMIEILSKLQEEHLSLEDEDRQKLYYKKRDEYNDAIKNKSDSNALLRAALFIYLNRTCFNGLYRVNLEGNFNVPAGVYKNPLICDTENILLVADRIKNVDIIAGDYAYVERFIDDKTFAYFDPPYRPLSNTSKFTKYTKGMFDDEEQKRLAEFIIRCANKCAKVLTTNSDPRYVDPEDDFFDELYKPLNIERISGLRFINRNVKDRGKVGELIISNY